MLEKAVLAAFTTDHACRTEGEPAARPRGALPSSRGSPATSSHRAQVVSLADYQQLADATTANRAGATR